MMCYFLLSSSLGRNVKANNPNEKPAYSAVRLKEAFSGAAAVRKNSLKKPRPLVGRFHAKKECLLVPNKYFK
jgi:hypothetical protein